MLVPYGWLSIYLSILVSYHLFLAWLLFTGKHKPFASLPTSYLLLSHLSCLGIILSLGMMRFFAPHFEIVCCAFAGLAFFEREWLFFASA
jgi:hypothetical protein